MVIPIVLAEVSDKIQSKGAFIIVCAIFVCTVSFFAVRRWLWPMLLEFTIIAIGTLMLAREFLLDRSMRDAVIAEQGVSYFIIAFVSLILPVITGITLYVTRRKKPANNEHHVQIKMKIIIAFGLILITAGSAYIWWWNQPIKQLADLAIQGQVPENWEELDEQYPHLCKTFRHLKIDPFDQTVEDASQEAVRISQSVYVTAGRHALGGIVAIIVGIALPIGMAIGIRRKETIPRKTKS